ncbi:MAG TPA: M20/M25/M40 family metallo-hydrolase [Mariniphaga anaerophila]|uniref:M20/M25/M40 family metallo-hydrolase n=1 Tax=Mariniphaga anaerophila TaxID=1484053 RepID=A0A831LLS9_9BACT|nr:M20/M25/M40 family metallo-hydrolase [Mariniphaga anaerophila]
MRIITSYFKPVFNFTELLQRQKISCFLKRILMMKQFLYSLVLVAFLTGCQPRYNPEITVDDIRETIEYLASDSLKGRKAGTQGDRLAAEYIRGRFSAAGLQLLFEDGFQYFELVTSATTGNNNVLQVKEETFVVKEDYSPYAFSANGTVEAPVVFAGYGLELDTDTIKWNDFTSLDVEGKWMLVLQGDPDMENAQSPFVEFSTERAKALKAEDKKAAGLILVAGPAFSEKDELSPLFFDKNVSRYSIPILQVTRSTANKILQNTGFTVEKLENEMLKKNASVNIETEKTISATVDVQLEKAVSQNVAALMPGTDPNLKDEYVVVGAHYDHLGMGGPGSGSRAPDTLAVHYGADDNASGVAAMIELAEKITAQKNNRRSVIFAAFGAEEMGLIGSKAFVAEPPVETSKITAMFNFDMVGRLDAETKALSIGGTQTAKETEGILNRLNPGFQLALSGEGIGPSDHASFYLQNIPVFFISTGAHADYHTPADKPDKINYEGAVEVMEFAHVLVSEIASLDSALTFREAGPRVQRSRSGRFRVSLGIMPDYAGMEDRGLRVDAVSPDKPAEKAGIQKGDIITAINGKKVGNIYDYMNRLQSLEAGQTISVDIIRGEQKIVLLVQLL